MAQAVEQGYYGLLSVVQIHPCAPQPFKPNNQL